MELGGVSNDTIHNLNPLSLTILIPIFDKYTYPVLARTGFKFTPIKKTTAGLACGTLSMVIAALIQHFIYVRSPCWNEASSCETPSPQCMDSDPAYIFIAFLEILASITGLGYVPTKAPKNMRCMIAGLFWFAQAFSSAFGQAFVALAGDPLLIWLYATIAVISAIGGVGFSFTFAKLDAEEDALNAIGEGFHKPDKIAGEEQKV